ncbi:MAG: hypothetical protein D6715_03440 [Calditrichaeota bacterium]|nr:MAG: hypothetical protein D6715_03440 [Calditrichota bacterium]
MMRETPQLFVVLENKPGSASRMCRVLQKKKISVYGIAMFIDSARLHVSAPEKALRALQENGYTAEIRQVLEVRLPNRQGALFELTNKLANAGINIEYMFGTIEEKQRHGSIILEVDDPELALSIFKNHKF